MISSRNMLSPTGLVFAALALSSTAFGAEPVTVAGLKNPESVAVGPGGKVYVTQIGEAATRRVMARS